jgi:hypothetical protein
MQQHSFNLTNFFPPKICEETISFWERHDQGDQIGRIFTHWVTDYFGQIFENYRSMSPTFWATFFPGLTFKKLTEKGLGKILGD